MIPKIIFRVCSVQELLQLRADILRPGLPIESAIFKGDEDKDTIHFGAFDGDNCLCCLTLMLNESEGKPAYQLRGMATAENVQGKGVGKNLIKFTYNWLASNSDVLNLWCNARIVALGFYRKAGWQVSGEEFMIEGVGPHFKMTNP